MALRRLFLVTSRAVIPRKEVSSLGVHCIRRQAFSTSGAMSMEQKDNLEGNPYFDKYADKIAKLQKTSPEEFLDRLSKTGAAEKKLPSQVEEKGFSFPSEPKNNMKPESLPFKEKKLDSIMKTELLMDKSKEEISSIWQEYHSKKTSISAVIPVEVFDEMKIRFREFNTFLFPLPRKEGYEFVVAQFSGHEAHFTTLINFQAYKENAPECLTMVHYPELAQEKGIVLMVGEFDSNVLSIAEAQCLANQVEMYYYRPSPPKSALMDTFLRRPNEFKHADLIAQMESVALDLPSSSHQGKQ
eukprot:TRINITY_DN6124_c0_g2_i2.p1 TRINITY_DN6124_c0_g2~~TRINITY_DN6124_c0_g2_i2.p1  ORF type:complete len:299 (-),score=98.79 TRINITY_DN6124_c0_g2_i2:231-1127(-)